MMKKNVLFAIALIILPGNGLFAQKQITAKTWDPVELDFIINTNRLNPYIETINENSTPYFSAEFDCESCQAKKIIINGFWDGGRSWKIRFAAPEPGTWTYTTISADKRLDGKKGRILVSAWSDQEKVQNPCRRGFVYVNQSPPRPGRYFIYADSTPFLWIGDTWWNWTKKDIAFEYFKNLVDTRAKQGFTVGQLFFPGNGWSPSSSMLDSTYTFPDFEHIRKVEEMIRYANEKGITIWIHAWWSRKNMNNTVGRENMIRWWKYVIDRLSSYNVIWVLAGEYNMYNYGGMSVNFWNDLGNIIVKEDPYKRIISVHPTPPGWDGGDDAPQWSTAEVLHNQSWLSYNQSQVGHGKWRNEMIPGVVSEAYHKSPAKPIVVTEPWYEFVEGNPSAMDIRLGAWSALLSGAAGHTYGGGQVWMAHVPGSPENRGFTHFEKSFDVNTLVYPGALSISYMSEFMHSIKWWKLEPHPELVLDNPSRFCSADVGTEYLIYLRYGGSFVLDLSGTPEKNVYSADWIDLTSGEKVKTATIPGGKAVRLKIPEDYPEYPVYKDWLVHIYR